jgi:hypothetical protein
MSTLYDKARNDNERDTIHSMWAPMIDLESSDINPDVHRCLFDYLGHFIAAWKARSVRLEDRVVENATAALYHSFDFNANMDWDPIPYHEQMTVRHTCSISPCNLLTSLPESRIPPLPPSQPPSSFAKVQGPSSYHRLQLPSHRRSSPRATLRRYSGLISLLPRTLTSTTSISYSRRDPSPSLSLGAHALDFRMEGLGSCG